MASYLVLLQFTDQGVRNVKDSPKREASAVAFAKKLGIKVKEAFWTLGAFDGALVLEAPDDSTVTAWALGVSSLGNVKTQTLPAFASKEFSSILGKLEISHSTDQSSENAVCFT